MRSTRPLALALCLGAATPTAVAQFAAVPIPPAKSQVTMSSASFPGGFLGGVDDCNVPHVSLGSGDLLSFPFNTGTTGSEGQNEASCYEFGLTGVGNDVWFDWTATIPGIATLSTCNGTALDTKLAAWPISAGCPADGTSLACSDDACGLQSSATWPVLTGTSYTLQVGTFPGAPGGTGILDIQQGPAPLCGTYDSGLANMALGLVAGGEIGWLHGQDCLLSVDLIGTAYSLPGGPFPPNGNPSRIVAYEDADCDGNPTTGPPVLMWSVMSATVNVGTNLFNNVPAPPGANTTASSRCTFVMATADHLPNEYPAPLDTASPTPQAWIAGNTPGPGTMNLQNLNLNNVPPIQAQAIGFPTAFLLRPTGAQSPNGAGTPTCFGLGNCPCSNPGDAQGGCENGLGIGGALLSALSTASLTADTLVLRADRTPDQPGVFFQGLVELNPPLSFGDGLRCCGAALVRIGTYLPAGGFVDTATGNQIGGIGPPISAHPGNAGLMPGDSRCYQWWYRDPGVANPCQVDYFNLSNAVLVTWQ